MRSRTALGLLAVVAVFAVVQLVGHEDSGSGSSASPTTASQPGARAGEAEQVPVDVGEHEAIAQVLTLIDAGGPYPNRADGEVFENREGLLPRQARDYYRSYTVPTPGSEDRGARRIITGQGGELFYTSDHYDNFKSIDRADFQ